MTASMTPGPKARRPEPAMPDLQTAPQSNASAAANGAKWTIAAMIVRQVGRFGFSIVLARLLGPEDYGVIAAATIYILLTSVLLETSLSATMVQKPDLRRQDEGAVFWTITGVGVLLTVITLFGAGVMASFLGIPEVAGLLMLLAITPPLKGLSMVPTGRLHRKMRFKAMAMYEIISTIIGGAAGVAAAAMGAGYWSLGVQQICVDFLIFVVAASAAGMSSLAADRAGFREVIRFGLPLLGSQTIGYVQRNADSVIVSRYLGAVDLALYSVPYRLMMIPVSLLGNVATRVAFPVFARLHGQPDRLASAFLRITRLIAVPAVPGMVLMVVLAPETIETIFGAEWTGATPVLQALALSGILQALTTTGGAIFMGTGRADLAMRWALIELPVVVGSFLAGLPWGIVGIAAAYSIVNVVITPFLVRTIGHLAGFTLGAWMRAVAPTFFLSVPAAGAAWLTRTALLAVDVPVPAVLVVSATTGIAVFTGLLRLCDRSLFGESVDAGRMLLRGKLGSG